MIAARCLVALLAPVATEERCAHVTKQHIMYVHTCLVNPLFARRGRCYYQYLDRYHKMEHGVEVGYAWRTARARACCVRLLRARRLYGNASISITPFT